MVSISLEVGPAESLALRHIERVRAELAAALRSPTRWQGLLRRKSTARVIMASNQLSGHPASLDDALAAVDRDEPFDADPETWSALRSYHEALAFVGQLTDTEPCPLDRSTLRAVHFILTQRSSPDQAGRWRDEEARAAAGAVIDSLPALTAAGGAGPPDLQGGGVGDGAHPMVRGALAHLGLTASRPFEVANHRTARLAHALLTGATPGIDAVWGGIDEYLAANDGVYRQVLAEVTGGAGRWAGNPAPWIRFCLTAHYRQAASLLSRVQDAEKLWATCTLLAVDNGVPVRSVGALTEVAQGLRLRNSTYRVTVGLCEHDQITDQTASRDLKTLVDAGLLHPKGDKRARVYRGGVLLRAAWAQIRSHSSRSGATGDPLAPDFAS